MTKYYSIGTLLWTKYSHWTSEAFIPGLELNLCCYILILNSSEKLLSAWAVEHQNTTLSRALKPEGNSALGVTNSMRTKSLWREIFYRRFSAKAKIELYTSTVFIMHKLVYIRSTRPESQLTCFILLHISCLYLCSCHATAWSYQQVFHKNKIKGKTLQNC